MASGLTAQSQGGRLPHPVAQNIFIIGTGKVPVTAAFNTCLFVPGVFESQEMPSPR